MPDNVYLAYAALGIVIAWVLLTIAYVITQYFSKNGYKYQSSLKIMYYIWLIMSIFLISSVSTTYGDESVEYAMYGTLAIFFIMSLIAFVMIYSNKQFNGIYWALTLFLIIALVAGIIFSIATGSKISYIIVCNIYVFCIIYKS